jgi:hypothetical protein
MEHHQIKPLVFIIDIDGTIIGNIINQLIIYEFKYDHINIHYSFKELFDRFDKGLIRPYFDTFIKNTKRRLPHSEFFFYTASEDRWGLFIANAIEKYYNIRFNRPIFTRKYCFSTGSDFKKSLKHITPHLKRTLQKKYGKNLDLTNRVLLIDNRQVYQSSDQTSLLICPTYNFMCLENIPAFITESIFNTHKVTIENKIRRYIPSILPIRNYIDFQRQYYNYYIKELKYVKSEDRFWFYLSRLLEIKNITIFTAKAVEYINYKLKKRL